MDMNRRMADGFFTGAVAATVAQLAGPGGFGPGVGRAEGTGPGAIIVPATGVVAGSTGIERLAAALPMVPAGVEGEAHTRLAEGAAYGVAAPPA
jgi:hypothetical protein